MNFPHQYHVTATGRTTDCVTVRVPHADPIDSHAPKEFGGPGDQWSPEDLLVAAVANCFILSFRAIARMSKFEWNDIECHVCGTLDKVDRVVQFTELKIHAKLTAPAEADTARAQRLLEKAEATCFITNSLKCQPQLETEICS